jgi:hypothetical protein
MIKLYLLIIAGLCMYIFVHTRFFRFLKQLWHESNLNANREKLTMFDVRQLLIKGEKDLAIRVYRELFKTEPEEACKAVEEIEKHIQPKDFEL